MLARPSPFYVLDEVDAALDDANIERFLELVERYRDRAQFIIITHQQLHDGDRRRALRRLDGRRRHLDACSRAASARATRALVEMTRRLGRGAARARRAAPERRRRAGGAPPRLLLAPAREPRPLQPRARAGPHRARVRPATTTASGSGSRRLLIAADVGVPATVEIVEALEAEAAAGPPAARRGAAARRCARSSPSVLAEPLERRALDLRAEPAVDPRRRRQRHGQDDDDRQARLPAARGRARAS